MLESVSNTPLIWSIRFAVKEVHIIHFKDPDTKWTMSHYLCKSNNLWVTTLNKQSLIGITHEHYLKKQFKAICNFNDESIYKTYKCSHWSEYCLFVFVLVLFFLSLYHLILCRKKSHIIKQKELVLKRETRI